MRRVLPVLLLAALAGCSSSTPAVPVPRDAAGLHGCPGPTARLADLVSPASARPAGDGCLWTDPAGDALLRADVRAGGLAPLYRASSQFRGFRAGEVDGTPTVVTTPVGDPNCSLHAGVTDGEVLVVQVGPARGPVPDPCGVATTVATRLLYAMPPLDR